MSVYIHRWTIKARVTNKSKIRTWTNSRGEGKLFSFEIVDESVSKGVEGSYCIWLLPVNVGHTWLIFASSVRRNVKWKRACQQGEIKITAFNKEVDKFFSLVEQGKVSKIPLIRIHPHLKWLELLWKFQKKMWSFACAYVECYDWAAERKLCACIQENKSD